MNMIVRILITIAICLSTIPIAAALETALDRYVAKPDDNFTFERFHVEKGSVGTEIGGIKLSIPFDTHFFSMTSQQWRDEIEVDRSIWKHDLSITIPLGARLNSTGILFVDGSNNDGPPVMNTPEEIALLAIFTNSIIAVVRQVPNQPLYFLDEQPPRRRTEDAILAYSLGKFLDSCVQPSGCDEEWPVHLAMTKSVVRAMDAVQQFLKKRLIRIDGFIVAGASKRGWTTWLIAAADPRVKGIVPVSIDVLNMDPQVDRHWESYGFYSEALNDYSELDIFCRAKGSNETQKLLKIIDPFEYRDRLTMPKFIINSAGDQFFLPDSSRYYYQDLIGDNRLRYSFNTDHGHSQNDAETDLLMRAITWVRDIKNKRTPPQYEWTVVGSESKDDRDAIQCNWEGQPNGTIVVRAVDRPKKVLLWQASNTNSRDFRLQTIGQAWLNTELLDQGNGCYFGYVSPPPPGQGWVAYSVELTFNNPLESDQVFTTDIVVKPDDLPFAGQHCVK